MDITLHIAHQQRDGHIFTYGPLIHNPQVLDLLENKGVHVVKRCDDLAEGTVVIRAHGISPAERRTINARPVIVVDATCPRVGQVQSIIKRHAARGYHIVIMGHEDHPEVLGLKGFAEGGCTVLCSMEELDRVPPADKICVVAQTTQRRPTFRQKSAMFSLNWPSRR